MPTTPDGNAIPVPDAISSGTHSIVPDSTSTSTHHPDAEWFTTSPSTTTSKFSSTSAPDADGHTSTPSSTPSTSETVSTPATSRTPTFTDPPHPYSKSSWCHTRPHTNWHPRHSRYYNLFPGAPCRFPDCEDACSANNATIAFPRTPDEWASLQSFINLFTGSAFLGLFMPLSRAVETACQGAACNDVLVYSNGTSFRYQSWMGAVFNRQPRQPRCFVLIIEDNNPATVVRPAPCPHFHMAICQSECPRPGFPIPPASKEHQLSIKFDVQFMALQRLRHLQDLSKTNPTKPTPELPAFRQGFSDDFSGLPLPLPQHSSGPPSFPTDPNFGVSTSDTDLDLVGYDCSHPRDVTPVQMGKSSSPCGPPPTPMTQRNASFALLYKYERRRIPVYQCRLSQTVLPYYCGVYSHTVLAPDWLQIEESLSITPEACRSLWTTKSWTDERGTAHQLEVNTTNRIYFRLTGDISMTTSGPTCEGGDYHYQGKTYPHMVVTVTKKIELFELEATVDENNVIHVPKLNTILPCPMEHNQCMTGSSGTFSWTDLAKKDACPYVQTRITKGIIITDSDNKETYMSTDKSMIRLLLKDPI